jgi:hypothetical protein
VTGDQIDVDDINISGVITSPLRFVMVIFFGVGIRVGIICRTDSVASCFPPARHISYLNSKFETVTTKYM